MRELTACGSCEFVWLDSFDSFIVAAAADGSADANADADMDPAEDVVGKDKDTFNGHGNDNGKGNVNGAAAAHVCPKYKKAILAAAGNQVAVAFSSSLAPFFPRHFPFERFPLSLDSALFMALCVAAAYCICPEVGLMASVGRGFGPSSLSLSCFVLCSADFSILTNPNLQAVGLLLNLWNKSNNSQHK